MLLLLHWLAVTVTSCWHLSVLVLALTLSILSCCSSTLMSLSVILMLLLSKRCIHVFLTYENRGNACKTEKSFLSLLIFSSSLLISFHFCWKCLWLSEVCSGFNQKIKNYNICLCCFLFFCAVFVLSFFVTQGIWRRNKWMLGFQLI